MKVGEFVRTNCGIAKIKSFELKNKEIINLDKDIMICNMDIYRNCCTKSGVIKSSPNILELLEEHDFITIEYYSLRYDERVERIFEVDYKDEEFTTLKNAYCDFRLKNNEFNDSDKALEPIVKSVITREQIENVEYRIGE